MSRKKVCVVITARASYSRFRSALTAINEHSDLDLFLVVSSSALLNKFGSAAEVIESDGFTIGAKVYNALESGNNLIGQAKTTGLGIIELSNVFNNEKPDYVVTIADRYETMATAIAASYMNIPLIHIQGGEVTGNIDEKVRHSITKLADLHLVSTELAKERVLKLGEQADRVCITGCPSIDIADEVNESESIQKSFDIYKKYGGVGSSPDYSEGYLVVMQHSVASEYEQSQQHIEETLQAISTIGMPTFWFWPNMDVGTDGISKGIRIERELNELENIHFFKNMEPVDFLVLLKNSKCIVGNSSVGIRECSFLGVPTVNIGSRQGGRERGPNVMDVDYVHQEIEEAIYKQLEHGPYSTSTLYGEGNAGVKIADVIAQIDLTTTKKLSY
ncbi:MAG: UDP-N-acetylglucosamine 2-epimerase (hydrolyzing) [Flavobacteriales bacterium]|nr:UDP-N-acetylglucosamine 2-epimerase (hydrolyzing) [Flavobacteriales bacterium]